MEFKKRNIQSNYNCFAFIVDNVRQFSVYVEHLNN